MDTAPNSQIEILSGNEPAKPGASLPERPRGTLLPSVFREERFFLVLSVLIGIFSGLAVVSFRFAIDWCRIYFLGSGATPSPLRLLLAPSIAGLIIALLVIHVFPLTRGSGVNQPKAAWYIYNGYIPLRTAIGKFVTAALAIGSGYSLGLEDPVSADRCKAWHPRWGDACAYPETSCHRQLPLTLLEHLIGNRSRKSAL